jgi:hypothetical protein
MDIVDKVNKTSNIDNQRLEEKAQQFLSQGLHQEAYNLFRKSAQGFQKSGNYIQAAYCFACAASSWNRKAGERLFYNAAASYEEAAVCAQKKGDYEYASLLYKHAAINYERDGEYFNYSNCFYLSKETLRKSLALSLLFPRRVVSFTKPKHSKGLVRTIKDLANWLLLTFSAFFWGHGERPSRTVLMGVGVVFLFAFIYSWGVLFDGAVRFAPNYFQSLYFSAVTFTTVGYGDLAPLGVNRLIASLEALIGLFIMPLFVVGLSRKYLRV